MLYFLREGGRELDIQNLYDNISGANFGGVDSGLLVRAHTQYFNLYVQRYVHILHAVLYISTSVWVLHTPNAGQNLHFQRFLC